MYTGTLIDRLIATVERTEARSDFWLTAPARQPLPGRKTRLRYAVAQQEVAQLDSSLAGVA